MKYSLLLCMFLFGCSVEHKTDIVYYDVWAQDVKEIQVIQCEHDAYYKVVWIFNLHKIDKSAIKDSTIYKTLRDRCFIENNVAI